MPTRIAKRAATRRVSNGLRAELIVPPSPDAARGYASSCNAASERLRCQPIAFRSESRRGCQPPMVAALSAGPRLYGARTMSQFLPLPVRIFAVLLLLQ